MLDIDGDLIMKIDRDENRSRMEEGRHTGLSSAPVVGSLLAPDVIVASCMYLSLSFHTHPWAHSLLVSPDWTHIVTTSSLQAVVFHRLGSAVHATTIVITPALTLHTLMA